MPKASKTEFPIIPCRLEPEVLRRVERYCEELKLAAPHIGTHGLTEEEFHATGLFHSAIEKLRGTRAATTSGKRTFIEEVLASLKSEGLILDWRSRATKRRHDFEVRVTNDWVCVIEAKGCLDGNNTTIYDRPPNAREFIIWSLCQNAAADPRHNVWSGIHTRLSAKIIKDKELVDGIIVWDALCGTPARPCPKSQEKVPPPCIFLLPATVPDPADNPKPPVHKLEELRFLSLLHQRFKGRDSDVTSVHLEAAMKDASICRRTVLVRSGEEVFRSGLDKIKRSR